LTKALILLPLCDSEFHVIIVPTRVTIIDLSWRSKTRFKKCVPPFNECIPLCVCKCD
jgi:hypothetical protein